MKDQRYGQRRVTRMYADFQRLREVIRREGTPDIQDAWDRVEAHVDYVYGAASAKEKEQSHG